MTPRGPARLSLVAIVVATVSACSAPTPPRDNVVHSGGALIVAIDAFPESLNPLVAGDVSSVRAYGPLFPNLYEVGSDLRPRPDLAAGLPLISADGLTWTVPLRPGARWSDGQPMDADDVVFTVRSESDPRLETRSHFDWSILANVERVDPLTVKFTLKKPYAPFLANTLVMPIVPRHVLASADLGQMSNNSFGSRPSVTGGPYRFANRVEGSYVAYERNPRYYGPRPNFDVVAMAVVRDPLQVGDALAEGRLQWAPGLTRAAAARTRGQVGVVARDYPELGYYALVMNTRPGHLFDSAAARQGLNLALDRAAITRAATGDDGQVLWGDINPGSWAFNASAAPAVHRDPAEAGRRLDAAGWTAPSGTARARGGQVLDTPLYFPSEDPSRRRAAEAMARQAAGVGIRLRPTALHGETVRSKLAVGDFEIALVAIGTGPDPDDGASYRTRSDTSETGPNPGGYSNPALDALVDQERAMALPSGDTAGGARRAVFGRIQGVLNTELPIIPLWTDVHHQSFNDSVSGVQEAGNNLDQDRASSFYARWYLHG